GLRTVAVRAGVDRKTARRYVAAAEAAGVVREGGEAQLSDEVIGQVVAAVRPVRAGGHGQAWEVLEAHRERVSEGVEQDRSVVKITDLLSRRGVLVPYRRGAPVLCRAVRVRPEWPDHSAGRRRRTGSRVPDRFRPDGPGP